jgi:hypothetical protein
MMRKIVANLFISLDGVVEEPGDWHFPYFNDEMGAAVDAVLATADTCCSGARPTTTTPGRGRSGRPRAGRTPRSPRSSATPASSS